jgi:hypothetical protein
LSVDSVFSADVAHALGDTVPVRSLGDAVVKGKAQPIPVFTFA